MVNNNMTFKCLCTVVLLCACCILTFAQERCIHDSVFLPELTIKNQEMCQYIANRLKKNKITNDTLFLEVHNEIYYLDKPMWIRKLIYRVNLDMFMRHRSDRIVLFISSHENYVSNFLEYTLLGNLSIKGYLYINDICIIVYDHKKEEKIFDKIDLFDTISSKKGRYFKYPAIEVCSYFCGIHSIEMDYFVKKNKLKKIYEHFKK